MKRILTIVCLWLLPAIAAAQSIEGTWVGEASLNGDWRPLRLDIRQVGGALEARYTLPQLDLEGIPLKVQFDRTTGKFTAGHALSGELKSRRLTGQLRSMLLHGTTVDFTLTPGKADPPPAVLEEDVGFRSRGLMLKGLLVRPQAPGRHPALVSLHGSGPSTRWLALARARRFARAGYAMLIFDKPGSGESEGDWTMTSLDEMADDAIAAVEFMRSRPEVDPSRVGLWGHSQAGWVISRAAARPSNPIAFAVVLAGGGTPPREVEEYGYINRLRRNGASPALTGGAISWVRRYLDYEATGQGYSAVVAELNQHPEWKAALGVATVYPTPEQQPKWAWVATYQPIDDIRRIRIPLLLLFADKDQESPAERSLELWRRGLAEAGNHRVEWRMFVDADHHFLTRAQTTGWPALAPEFYETQIDWLARTLGSGGERG